jgi:Bifunctional DNA primase/polymerase, N-terminal/AAA domain
LSNVTPLATRKPSRPALFPPTPDDPIVEHALHYASMGWPVLVVDPVTKISLKSAAHSNGLPWGQTTVRDEIVRDFLKWPNANVGVATGATAGFFVVETDTADGHGEGTDGLAALAKLEVEHGPLPVTLEAESPSGSIHRYFKHPGFKIKNSASEVAPGVDVRGDGGMVVAPPSVKPGKGTYRWRNALPIAEAPQWLLDRIVAGKEKPEPKADLSISQQALAMVRPRDAFDDFNDEARRSSGGGYIEAALRGESDEVARAPNGKRNHQLNVSSMKLGHYVGGGELHEKRVIDAMMEACRSNGLLAEDGTDQCLATIKSGLEKGKSQPKGIPERTADILHLPNAKLPEQQPAPLTAIHATPYVWRDPATIRRREWLYGRLLLRKFVSATISPGGTGKSSLVATEALAMVSGKDLLGVLPPSRSRVWLWNLEDPYEETVRKIQAAAQHYELDPDDLDGLMG